MAPLIPGGFSSFFSSPKKVSFSDHLTESMPYRTLRSRRRFAPRFQGGQAGKRAFSLMRQRRYRSQSGARVSFKPALTGGVRSRIPRAFREVPLYEPRPTKVRSEQKSIQVMNYGYALDDVPTVAQLPIVTQGDGLSNRLGNRITITQMRIRGTLAGAQSVTVGDPCTFIIRLLLVYDKTPNGVAPPAGNDIVTYGTYPQEGFQNTLTRDRYLILWDKRYSVNSPGWNLAGPINVSGGVRPFEINVACALDMVYDNTAGGAIANVRKGLFYLVAATDQLVGLADTRKPQISWCAQMVYSDS